MPGVTFMRNVGHFVRTVQAGNIATQINAGGLSAGAGLVVTATGHTIDTRRNPGATRPSIGCASPRSRRRPAPEVRR